MAQSGYFVLNINCLKFLTLLVIFTLVGCGSPPPDESATPIENIVVATPVVTAVTPVGPADNNNPVVSGTSDSLMIIKVYSDSACINEVGSGNSNATGSFNAYPAVANNTTTTFYAKAFNGTFSSACSTTFVTYIEDSVVPSVPILVSLTPSAATNNNNNPVLAGTADPAMTIKLYTNSTCTSAIIATTTSDGLGNFSFNLTVGDNSTTTYYATATSPTMVSSPCSATSLTYIEDSLAPSLITIVSSTPTSPGNSTTPTITGTAEANSFVELYTDSSCVSAIAAAGAADGSGNFSLGVTVTANTTTTFYGRATDAAGNVSACSSSNLVYVNDTISPSVPVISTTTPASPSDVNNPTVNGLAEANSTLQIYTNSSCASAVAATGAADGAGNFSLSVTATDNTTTTYWATATDAAGNVSACSATSVAYAVYSIPTGIAYLYGNTTTAPITNTNLNQAVAYSLRFTNVASEYHSTYYEHSRTVNPHQLKVKVAGDYFVSLTLPVSGAVAGASILAEVRVNGVARDVGRAASSYISNLNSHTESSIHLATLLTGLAVDDIIDITVIQAGAVGTITGTAVVMVEYIDSARNIFFATATQTTNSTNLNQSTAYNIQWTDSILDSSFEHDNFVSSDVVSLEANGNYIVYLNIPVTGTTANSNVKVRVKKNGSVVSHGYAQQGVIKGASHTTSSVHWSGVIPNAVAGDYLEVETILEAATATVTVPAGRVASIFIEHLPDDQGLYMSRTTTLMTNANWNNGTAQTVSWLNDDIKDVTYYSHSTLATQDRVTLVVSGDYLASINAPTTSVTANTNNRLRFRANGTVITGADAKKTYVSATAGHNDSSNNMTFLLRKRTAGQYIDVQSTREARSGTISSSGDASMFMIYKPNSSTP